jgi:hypothetical protein
MPTKLQLEIQRMLKSPAYKQLEKASETFQKQVKKSSPAAQNILASADISGLDTLGKTLRTPAPHVPRTRGVANFRNLPGATRKPRARQLKLESKHTYFQVTIGYLHFDSERDYHYDRFRNHGESRRLDINSDLYDTLKPIIGKTVVQNPGAIYNMDNNPKVSVSRYPLQPYYETSIFQAKHKSPSEIAVDVPTRRSPTDIAADAHENNKQAGSSPVVVSIKLEKVTVPKNIDISHIPGYRVNPVILDRFGKIDYRNATSNNQCVLDALELTYGENATSDALKWRTAFYFKPKKYTDMKGFVTATENQLYHYSVDYGVNTMVGIGTKRVLPVLY